MSDPRTSSVAEVAVAAMTEVASPATIFDLKVNYISTFVPGEELTASARVVHAGRRTVVAECRVQDEGGRLVATASGTFAATRNKE